MATASRTKSSRPAAMLELVCPGCETHLELDRGFAGGVCRCSNCGTLMTVPADPARERAERLTRPDTPGSTSKPARRSRPDRPESPTKPARPSRPDTPSTPSLSAAKGQAPASDDHVYTTASGRVIRLDGAAIPTASKRKIARWTTYAVFAAFMLLLLGAVALAVTVLLRPPPDPLDRRPGLVETFGYDPAANPFTLAQPNALGLPLRQSTVVVVDTSAQSEPWLAPAKDALKAGLAGHPGDNAIDLIYATTFGPISLHNGLRPLSDTQPDALAAFQAQVTAKGEASLKAGIDLALQRSPSHLVVLASPGGAPEAADIQAIEAALQAHPNIVVDVLAMGRDIVALEDLARNHAGRYQLISASKLTDWRTAAP